MSEKLELIRNIQDLQEEMVRSVGLMHPAPWIDLDLTIDQLKSLMFIEFEGKTSAKSLSEALKVTPPNVTGIIDRLVARGIVTREENPDDRRVTLLKVTEQGESMMMKLRETQIRMTTMLLERLNETELEALLIGIKALVRELKTGLEKRN